MYIRKLQKNISILRSSKINKTNNDRTTNNERKSNIYATHPINEEQQRISNRTVLINVSENELHLYQTTVLTEYGLTLLFVSVIVNSWILQLLYSSQTSNWKVLMKLFDYIQKQTILWILRTLFWKKVVCGCTYTTVFISLHLII